MSTSIITPVAVSAVVFYYFKRYIDNKTTNERLKGVQYLFAEGKTLDSTQTAKGIYARIKFFVAKDMVDKNGNAYWLAPYGTTCAWLIENCGLYELSQCKSDYEKLIKLGWGAEWIEKQLVKHKKCHFNLYLFPEKSSNYKVYWANWDGLFDFLRNNEYEIFKRTQKFKQQLKETTWQQIQERADFLFEEVDDKWDKDPRYLTKEKFLSIPQEKLTIVQVRFLFYCYMNVCRLFSGDGYTVDKKGNVGCKEFIVKNMRLGDINNIKMVPLKIKSAL